jgi:hypothetical protein
MSSKTPTQKKKIKPNMGLSLAEEKKKLNAAMDRLGVKRGGHRGMHHGPPKK